MQNISAFLQCHHIKTKILFRVYNILLQETKADIFIVKLARACVLLTFLKSSFSFDFELRISRTSKTFRLIFRTAKTVTNSFLICFALLLSVYYVFAIIGVEIFKDVVTKEITDHELSKARLVSY